jgi:hypothetical protein
MVQFTRVTPPVVVPPMPTPTKPPAKPALPPLPDLPADPVGDEIARELAAPSPGLVPPQPLASAPPALDAPADRPGSAITMRITPTDQPPLAPYVPRVEGIGRSVYDAVPKFDLPDAKTFVYPFGPMPATAFPGTGRERMLTVLKRILASRLIIPHMPEVYEQAADAVSVAEAEDRGTAAA